MTKNKEILLISVGVIIIVLAGFFLLGSRSPVNQEEFSISQGNEDSLNIFDAIIQEIDYKNTNSFIVDVDTSNIAGARENPMRKIIKLNETTKWIAYNYDKGGEWPTSFTEAKNGDNILVFSIEDLNLINDIEEFTALKVLIFK